MYRCVMTLKTTGRWTLKTTGRWILHEYRLLPCSDALRWRDRESSHRSPEHSARPIGMANNQHGSRVGMFLNKKSCRCCSVLYVFIRTYDTQMYPGA